MLHRRVAGLGAFLALVLASSPAIASDWWYVNSGPGRVLFIDAQSIERKKDVATYWAMYVIRPGEPEVMTKTHMRADCRTRKLGYLTEVRYDPQGRQIGHSPRHAGPMNAVPPDTLGDAEWHFACGDDGYRVTNDLFSVATDEVKFAEALIAHGNKPADAHELHETMTGRRKSAAPPARTEAAPVVSTPPAESSSAPQEEVSADEVGEPGRGLEKDCAAGYNEACARLAGLLATGDGVAKDTSRAVMLFEKACGGGDADSCTRAGVAYHNGEGVERNETRGAALFAQACAKGGPADCGNIGLAYVSGHGVAKDVVRAVGYFTAACEHGNASGCSSLGAAYSLGSGVKPDPRRALGLFTKGCDGGDANGCYNLGVVYDHGLGVKKDHPRAATLYVKACDADEGAACGNLGSLIQSGDGVPKDAVKAAALFSKACDLDDAEGCLNLGRVYQAGSGVVRDTGRAAASYRRALTIEPDMASALRALDGLGGSGRKEYPGGVEPFGLR